MPEDDGFEVQVDVRGPWRRFVDDVAPLRPHLLRYCCGLTGNLWDGEDLLQDLLVRVFGQLGKSNADLVRPRSYLVRAATNLWVDRLRRASLERAHLAAEQAEPPPDVVPASLGVDVRAAAHALFLELPPKERAAVLLSDVMDFSLQETASMLKTTVGAVKAALHRGRSRLKAGEPARRPATVPRDLVERFVAALRDRNLEAIRALCLADVTVDMVGGPTFDGFEAGKITLEYAHLVAPELGFDENPNWRVADYLGEPIAIGLRTLDGREGLNEIWRFEVDEGAVTRLRLYCLSPDVLATVAQEIGVPALRRAYRSP
jgi:RNA polymerase sigma-70 factor (ECF subfamily)